MDTFYTPLPKEPHKLGQYFNSPKYSDVILKVGPHTFHAHRLVMCSWSDVFKELLVAPSCPGVDTNPSDQATGPWPLEHNDNSIFRFDEEHDCCDVFHHFLRFMYTETLAISDDNALPLLKLSIKYEVEELKVRCEKYVSQSQRDLQSWIGTILPLAVSSNLEVIKVNCLRFLANNFEQICSQQLQSLDSVSIMALIDCKSPSIVAEDEFTVFQKLTPWLDRCTDEDDFMKVVDCIRFPFMSALQLMKLRSTDVIQRVLKDNPRFLINTCEQHALYREASLDEFSISVPQPRLYLRPPDSIRTSDNTSKVKPDKEGFCKIKPNREIPIRNVLQEVKSITGIGSRYEHERGSWYITVHLVPVFDPITPSWFDDVRWPTDGTYDLEVKVSQRATTPHKIQTDEDSMKATEQIAEVAVQILSPDGTLKLFVSKKPLPSRNPQGQSSQCFQTRATSEIDLFNFEMPIVFGGRGVPSTVQARIALLIHINGHDGDEGNLCHEQDEE